MDTFNCFLYLLIVSLSVLLSSICAQDVCAKKTPCSCEFLNGTGVDISESAKLYTAQIYQVVNNSDVIELSTYYYHPCFDTMMSVVNASSPGTCGTPVSMCRQVDSMTIVNGTKNYAFKQRPYEYMGSSNYTEFSPDGKSIIYNNGPSNTFVMLVCAETDDRLEVSSLENPNNVILSFYSRNACFRQLETGGRSTGSTLLIIFFSLVIFYLVLGVCTKKFLMGATGIEVVPNLAFWSDLPNLVRDGWMFTLSGFKLPPRGAGPATTPDPNSYDSI